MKRLSRTHVIGRFENLHDLLLILDSAITCFPIHIAHMEFRWRLQGERSSVSLIGEEPNLVRLLLVNEALDHIGNNGNNDLRLTASTLTHRLRRAENAVCLHILLMLHVMWRSIDAVQIGLERVHDEILVAACVAEVAFEIVRSVIDEIDVGKEDDGFHLSLSSVQGRNRREEAAPQNVSNELDAPLGMVIHVVPPSPHDHVETVDGLEGGGNCSEVRLHAKNLAEVASVGRDVDGPHGRIQVKIVRVVGRVDMDSICVVLDAHVFRIPPSKPHMQ